MVTIRGFLVGAIVGLGVSLTAQQIVTTFANAPVYTVPASAVNGAGVSAVPLKAPLFQQTTVYSGAGTVIPTCNAGAIGTRAFVSDAMAATFHTTYATGGMNNVSVVCDGTNWYID